jgi:TRAP-type C4-dicarboxylate transport system permease small subunit
MNKIVTIMDSLLSRFCVFLTVVLVSCVVWQVFSRYVLSIPSTSTDELARFLFIWVGLMGAAYTLGQGRHLAIDFLLTALEGKAKIGLQVFVDLAGIFFAGVIMVYGGGSLMLKTLNMGQVSPALGIEMGFVYAAIPISGFFMLVYLISDISSRVTMNATETY